MCLMSSSFEKEDRRIEFINLLIPLNPSFRAEFSERKGGLILV